MKKEKEKSKHDILCKELCDRLYDSGIYDKILLNLEYSIDGRDGEVDVLAYNKNGWIHFYEVKSTYTPKNLIKATSQYSKYKDTHKIKRIKGVMYTPQRVRRLI